MSSMNISYNAAMMLMATSNILVSLTVDCMACYQKLVRFHNCCTLEIY